MKSYKKLELLKNNEKIKKEEYIKIRHHKLFSLDYVLNKLQYYHHWNRFDEIMNLWLIQKHITQDTFDLIYTKYNEFNKDIDKTYNFFKNEKQI